MREHPASFAAFTALNSLYIGLSDLLATETWLEQTPPDPVPRYSRSLCDILPSSLRTLWLYCTDDGLFGSCIGDLGEAISQSPGLSLMQITLDGPVAAFDDYFLHTRPEWEWSGVHRNLERLELLCQDREITLNICDQSAVEESEAEETDNSDDSEVSDDSDFMDDADYSDGSRDPTYRDGSDNDDDTESEDDMLR